MEPNNFKAILFDIIIDQSLPFERVENAWLQLLKEGLGNLDLLFIITDIKLLRIKAWQQLLKQNPNYREVCYVAGHVELLRLEACQKLAEIISFRFCPQSSSAQEGEKDGNLNKNLKSIYKILKRLFCESSPQEALNDIIGLEIEILNGATCSDLFWIIENVESLRERAGQKILKQNPDIDDVFCIMLKMKVLKKVAWPEFLKLKPSNSYLIYIIKYVEFLREDAWQELLRRGMTKKELCFIILDIESLRQKAAEQYVKQIPRDKAKIVIDILRLMIAKQTSILWGDSKEIRLQSLNQN